MKQFSVTKSAPRVLLLTLDPNMHICTWNAGGGVGEVSHIDFRTQYVILTLAGGWGGGVGFH